MSVNRIRHTLEYLLYADKPMTIRDGDETYTVGMRDVRDIQYACGCSESEAMDRLAQWVVDKMEGVE